jgi:hypothetical protein
VSWVKLVEKFRRFFCGTSLRVSFKGTSDAGPREGLCVDGASLGPLSFALFPILSFVLLRRVAWKIPSPPRLLLEPRARPPLAAVPFAG